MTERQELESILKQMRRIKGVKGSLIARRDGLLVASDLPEKANPKVVAAMTAAMVKSSLFMTKELGMGKLNHAFIRASNGCYACFGINFELVLASLLNKKAKIKSIALGMEKSAKLFSKLLFSKV